MGINIKHTQYSISILHNQFFLTSTLTLGSCVKQQCDIGLSNSLLRPLTQPKLIEINKICPEMLAFEFTCVIGENFTYS